MNNDQKRAAILEFLGWKDLVWVSSRAMRGTSPEGKKDQLAPNPHFNLNVWQMVEGKMNFTQFQLYRIELQNISSKQETFSFPFDIVSASCGWRVEAFIRMRGYKS